MLHLVLSVAAGAGTLNKLLVAISGSPPEAPGPSDTGIVEHKMGSVSFKVVVFGSDGPNLTARTASYEPDALFQNRVQNDWLLIPFALVWSTTLRWLGCVSYTSTDITLLGLRSR